jgi:hypothetical protein
VKLLNNDEKRNYPSNNFPSTSNASSTAQNSKRNARVTSNHHKRFSLNENSIDSDNIDVSFAFPHDFDKYSDDIWRKTVSSECDQSIAVWEKQPESMASWGAIGGSGIYEPAPRNSSLYLENDRDIFSTGENFFYPTSGASSSWGASSSGRKLTTNDSTTRGSSRRKHHGNKVNSTSVDSDDEFQTIKKRLSLSSLRNSLCRQRALENLNNNNNDNQNQSGANENNNATVSVNAGSSNDDFLQVFIIFSFSFHFRFKVEITATL